MFFDNLARFSNNVAAIDGDEMLTYSQLIKRCDNVSADYKITGPSRKLIFLKAQNSVCSLIHYLAAIRHGHVVMLIDPKINDASLSMLLGVYQPNLLVDDVKIKNLSVTENSMDPRLCLLLSTSGSTGSPKQVALSYKNIHSNALSISEYLPIKPSDKTITTLPFYYSYGLSVVHTHLHCGACIVFNDNSIVSREFWSLFKYHQINSFAGVPYTYDMLFKLRFERMELPSLRYITQAGGKLPVILVNRLSSYCVEHHKLFFKMYGQTEATARIAYQPLNDILVNPEAIGTAIPGGKLYIVDQSGVMLNQANIEGELVYEGENIMLGYASQQNDLANFTPAYKLHTGDVGKIDEDNNIYITGRKKRFIKLFGQRISLDEVEHIVLSQSNLKVYAFGDDSKLVLAVSENDIENQQRLKNDLARRLSVHHSAIELMTLDKLPMSSNGKKDYVAVINAFSDYIKESKSNE